LFQFMERVGPMDPTQRVFGVQLNQGGGNIQCGLLFLCGCVNSPAHVDDIRVLA
jgi:hypothetical protein